MLIRKSVHINLLLISPILFTALWIVYKLASIDLTRFWMLSSLILILIVHYFRCQSNMLKHFISIDDNKLEINSKAHKIQFNFNTINEIQCTNNILNISSNGLEYEFDLAMFDVRKSRKIIEELKKKTF